VHAVSTLTDEEGQVLRYGLNAIEIVNTLEVTMPRQRRGFTPQEIQRIIWLLASTDMTMKQIAERMRCSHSAVVAINRKSNTRDYAGRRATWVDSKLAALTPIVEA